MSLAGMLKIICYKQMIDIVSLSYERQSFSYVHNAASDKRRYMFRFWTAALPLNFSMTTIVVKSNANGNHA